MTERIISADSHLELKPEKILAHLPRQHHEAYQGALDGDASAHPRGEAAEAVEEQVRRRRGATVGCRPRSHGRPPVARERTTRTSASKDMDIDRVDAEVLYASATGGAEFYTLDADACLAAFPATTTPRSSSRRSTRSG